MDATNSDNSSSNATPWPEVNASTDDWDAQTENLADWYQPSQVETKYWELAETPIGAVVPFKETCLGKCSPEILELIFSYLLGTDHKVDITIPHAKHGSPRLVFRRWFPHLKEAFQTVLLASKDLREVGLQHLSTVTKFENRYSDSAKHLHTVFGGACSMIHSFDLKMDFRTKVMHEWQFPPLLKLLKEDMANLTRFRLISEYPTSAPTYAEDESGDPEGSVDRDSQERRAILRFGAFVTLRHPKLVVMVLPAESGPTNEVKSQRTTTWIELYTQDIRRPVRKFERFAERGAAVKTEYSDLVMDSARIRRYKWTELAQEEPIALALNLKILSNEDMSRLSAADLHNTLNQKTRDVVDGKNIKSSEVPAIPNQTNFNEQVDSRGYLTWGEAKQRGFKQLYTVDELIDDTREVEIQILEAVSDDLSKGFQRKGRVDVMKLPTPVQEAQRQEAARRIEEGWKQKWNNRVWMTCGGGRSGGRGNIGSRGGRGGAGRGIRGGYRGNGGQCRFDDD